MKFPIFFTSFPTLFILFLFLAILLDLKWYVIVLDLWTLFSVWLISIYSDANINLWCFDYCNFRVSFEILESVCPSTVFFLKTTLDILRLLHLYMNFRIHLPIYFFLSYLGFQ